jgi:hypothetical protein
MDTIFILEHRHPYGEWWPSMREEDIFVSRSAAESQLKWRRERGRLEHDDREWRVGEWSRHAP